MQEKLTHGDIQRMVMALDKAKVINLDASIRELLEPVGKFLDPGSTVGLHIVCCNEYGLITGITGQMDEVVQPTAIKEAVERSSRQ